MCCWQHTSRTCKTSDLWYEYHMPQEQSSKRNYHDAMVRLAPLFLFSKGPSIELITLFVPKSVTFVIGSFPCLTCPISHHIFITSFLYHTPFLPLDNPFWSCSDSQYISSSIYHMFVLTFVILRNPIPLLVLCGSAEKWTEISLPPV